MCEFLAVSGSSYDEMCELLRPANPGPDEVSNLDHPFYSAIASLSTPASIPVASIAARVLSIRESHAHGHQRAGAVRSKSGFNVVVGRRIWQVHALDMNDPAVRLKFEVLAREVESMALAIRPLITDLAARPGVTAADGHRPTFRTEQPLLDQFRIGMSAVNGFGRGGESPGHNQ